MNNSISRGKPILHVKWYFTVVFILSAISVIGTTRPTTTQYNSRVDDIFI